MLWLSIVDLSPIMYLSKEAIVFVYLEGTYAITLCVRLTNKGKTNRDNVVTYLVWLLTNYRNRNNKHWSVE
jgi:secreted Zn-dependent insulinase-like peptidase